MLVDGQIDLLAGLAKTDERLGIIGYPEFPMGSETYNMIKHSEDDRITMSYSTLNGMRIGVLDSAMVQVLQKFLDAHNIKEALNKSRRAPDGSFSVMLRQSALDVALLRLRALFLA